jgi:hypothetical protein
VISRRRGDVKRTGRQRLGIRSLSPEARRGYAERWHALRSRFADRPSSSLREADDLLIALLVERGYPVDDLDDRVAAASLEYPGVADRYRAAHAVARSTSSDAATVDQMSEAIGLYDALFDELLASEDPADADDRRAG